MYLLDTNRYLTDNLMLALTDYNYGGDIYQRDKEFLGGLKYPQNNIQRGLSEAIE